MVTLIRVMAICSAIVLGHIPVAAEEARGHGAVVVELFTSQGCSSCPPADELMTMLAAREDVIALSLHVDYWDYIGWADNFAQAKFTKRQRAYARIAGSRTIYTPQMVVAGQDHVIGTRPMELAMVLDKHKGHIPAVDLRLRRQDGTLTIEAGVPQTPTGKLVVYLVRMKPSETIAITRGENRGKTITYVNIVTQWEEIAQWAATDPLTVQVPDTGELPVAVLVQRPGPGAIVAAAQMR